MESCPQGPPPSTELRSGAEAEEVTLSPTMSAHAQSAPQPRDKQARARQGRDNREQTQTNQMLLRAGAQVAPASPSGVSAASVASPPHKKAAADPTDNMDSIILAEDTENSTALASTAELPPLALLPFRRLRCYQNQKEIRLYGSAMNSSSSTGTCAAAQVPKQAEMRALTCRRYHHSHMLCGKGEGTMHSHHTATAAQQTHAQHTHTNVAAPHRALPALPYGLPALHAGRIDHSNVIHHIPDRVHEPLHIQQTPDKSYSTPKPMRHTYEDTSPQLQSHPKQLHHTTSCPSNHLRNRLCSPSYPGGLPMYCQCIADVLPMSCRCIADILPMYCRCIADVSPMYCRCIADVLPMFCRCITVDSNPHLVFGNWSDVRPLTRGPTVWTSKKAPRSSPITAPAACRSSSASASSPPRTTGPRATSLPATRTTGCASTSSKTPGYAVDSFPIRC